MTELPADFADLLLALLGSGAHFMIVGGYAVAHHGHPRATKDIDVWVRADEANAGRVIEALKEFGAPLRPLRISAADFAVPGQTIQLGVAPLRIDLLTAIEGVDFDAAWQTRAHFDLGSHRVPVLGRAELIASKRAAGRPRDLADVAVLEESD